MKNVDVVDINGTLYDVTHITHLTESSSPLKNDLKKEDMYILSDSLGKGLITINLGRQTQDLVIPLMFSVFIDHASFEWRIRYTNMFTTAIARSVREITYQSKMLDFEYSKYDLQRLKEEQNNFRNGFEFLRNTLIRIRNQVETENKIIKKHYSTIYQRNLSRFFGGGISKAIREESPLLSLDKLDITIDKMDTSVEEISELSVAYMTGLSKLIEAKEKKDIKSFDKVKNYLKDFSTSIDGVKTIYESEKSIGTWGSAIKPAINVLLKLLNGG